MDPEVWVYDEGALDQVLPEFNPDLNMLAGMYPDAIYFYAGPAEPESDARFDRLLEALLLSQSGDVYYCPVAGAVESATHGGFDVCCDAPQLHRTYADLIKACVVLNRVPPRPGDYRAIQAMMLELRHDLGWG